MFRAVRSQLQESFANLRGIEGNSRACLITEPLWGIPFNLYTTYASLYMLALGISEERIGIVVTLNVAVQVVFALIGGFVTDKLGRRRTSIIFDLISWSIPTLLWAFARSYAYFVIGAMLNAVVRVVHTSWSCLLIEDARPEQRVHIYSWIHVAGILAGFFAPIAGIFVTRFGLVPSVRGLYLFAFFMMTFMFILRNHLTVETRVGVQRIRESRGVPLMDSIREYGEVLKGITRNRILTLTVVLMLTHNIYMVIKGAFLSILLSEGLGLSLGIIAVVPAVHSVIQLGVLFILMPSLTRKGEAFSLFSALTCLALSSVILLITPPGSIALVMVSTVLSAFGFAVAFPFIESTLANTIDIRHRAKGLSLVFGFLLAMSSPFGYIAGILAARSPKLPFVLLLGIQLVSIVLVFFLAAEISKGRRTAVRNSGS